MRWQYRIIETRLLEEQDLDQFGEDGWELVGFVPTTSTALKLVFKRPVQE